MNKNEKGNEAKDLAAGELSKDELAKVTGGSLGWTDLQELHTIVVRTEAAASLARGVVVE